jgi:hypothetical protein
VVATHTLVAYPKEMQKKVTLLQHFRSYLETDPKSAPEAPPATQTELVYVKKWIRTKHAIMFRLSNKIVQVSFEDRTEIILNSESREIEYVNKKGSRETFALNTALDSGNAEMTKRLKYTKDILMRMLSGSQQPQQPGTIVQYFVHSHNRRTQTSRLLRQSPDLSPAPHHPPGQADLTLTSPFDSYSHPTLHSRTLSI